MRKFMGCRMHSSDYLRFLARRRLAMLVVLRGGMCDIKVHKIISAASGNKGTSYAFLILSDKIYHKSKPVKII